MLVFIPIFAAPKIVGVGIPIHIYTTAMVSSMYVNGRCLIIRHSFYLTLSPSGVMTVYSACVLDTFAQGLLVLQTGSRCQGAKCNESLIRVVGMQLSLCS